MRRAGPCAIALFLALLTELLLWQLEQWSTSLLEVDIMLVDIQCISRSDMLHATVALHRLQIFLLGNICKYLADY